MDYRRKAVRMRDNEKDFDTEMAEGSATEVRRGARLQEAPRESVPCLNELVGPEIGTDQDFANEALRREEWKSLEKLERQQNTSISRQSLFHEGFHAGYSAAVDDYLNGKATVEHFEGIREHRDITDFYSMGFELGYFRKLSEILVG